MYRNAYLFSKHEKRSWKGLFPVGTVYRRLVDQRSLAFCCQHLSFLSVNTNIGVHTQTQQSYDLKRNNQVTSKSNVKALRFAAVTQSLPVGVTQVSRDVCKDSFERELQNI